MAQADPLLSSDIERVRHFDRYYDRRLRDLHVRALILEFSWLELRIVQEIGNAGEPRSLSWIADQVQRDKGYVCRALKVLRAYGFVQSATSFPDRRYREYDLTQAGRKHFEGWEKFHREDVHKLVEPLPPYIRRQLVRAMLLIERIMNRTFLENFEESWYGPRKRAPYFRRFGARRTGRPARRAPAAAG